MVQTIEELLVSGCDERIQPRGADGTNQYFLNPFEFEGLLHRGTCTASTLDPESLSMLEALDLGDMEKHFEEVVEDHAKRIKALLQTPDGTAFEVFFAPSGSDLAYYPLLFKQMLSDNKEVVNLVTCPEELGSGTRLATRGLFHAAQNQFGDAIPKEGDVPGIPAIELCELRGRNDQGHIVDNHKEILEAVERFSDRDLIVNLVYGSKSGIEDNLAVLEDLSSRDILCTVDLCQFRNSKHLVQQLLAEGCLIFLTGSKFYQSPPFCGCMLVPEIICEKLDDAPVDAAIHYRKLYAKYDIPKRFSRLRKELPDFKNLGLHLRWKCAIREMEEFDNTDKSETLSLIEQWNSFATNRLSEKGCFELMPDMQLTNKSIISFKVKTEDAFWDYDQLWDLFKRLVTGEYDLGPYRRIFIGQPVRYDNGSFLRLALGARNVMSLLQIPEERRFRADAMLIDFIEKAVRDA